MASCESPPIFTPARLASELRLPDTPGDDEDVSGSMTASDSYVRGWLNVTRAASAVTTTVVAVTNIQWQRTVRNTSRERSVMASAALADGC